MSQAARTATSTSTVTMTLSQLKMRNTRYRRTMMTKTWRRTILKKPPPKQCVHHYFVIYALIMLSSLDGKANVITLPGLEHGGLTIIRKLTFNAGDIYANIKGLSFPLLLAISYGENLAALQQNQATILKVLTGKGILDTSLRDLAQAGGYVIDASTGTIMDAIGTISTMYRKYILWIGIPVLVGLIIVIGIILACKCYLYKAIFMGTNKRIIISAVDTEILEQERVELGSTPTAPPQIPSDDEEAEEIHVTRRGRYPPLFTYVPVIIPLICSVSSSEAIHLLYITISIEDRGITALWDTGASISYLRRSTLDYIAIKRLSETKIRELALRNQELPFIPSGTLAFEPTEHITPIMIRRLTKLQPKTHTVINITFTDHCENEMILLKDHGNKSIQFQETVVHPIDSSETILRVYNTTKHLIVLPEGMVLGQASIVKPYQEGNVYWSNETYVPPEADWEGQLPHLPNSEDEFMEELQLTDCTFNTEIIKRNRKDGQIGCLTVGLEHTIDIRTDLPFPRPRVHRIPLAKIEEVERQVKELVKQGVIEPSISTFTSPIVLVKKKDNTFRFTTDFRALNSVKVKQTYLIPNITDIVDLAAGSQYLSNFDLIMGFFQIPLRRKDRHLTAFTTTTGTWQYKRMPMGLCGAPHTFQSAVRLLQQKVKCKLFVYLDDLLLTSNSAEQNLNDIEELLQAVTQLGLKMKLKKCRFGCKEVTFLGLIIGRDGVKPNPEKIKAIKDFPAPKNITALRDFIGMTNYFRRFIKNYAKIASPLYDLTKKETEFNWSRKQEEAFTHLKRMLCEAPVLSGPIPKRPFIIESDASTIAIGAILLQSTSDEEPEHPIAFASRKLVKAERNYPPIEIEALALTFAVHQFRTYILGTPVLAIVDHRPLTSLMKRKDLIGRLAKFQVVLAEYDIGIEYRPGKENNVCDALSRYIGDESNEPRPKQCPWILKTIENLNESVTEQGDREKEKIRNRYEVHNGIFYNKPQGVFKPPTVVIPRNQEVITRIIEKFHNTSYLGAHHGMDKTKKVIKRRFNWTRLDDDVREFVRNCAQCQRRKSDPHQATKEPMGTLEDINMPCERWIIDILEPLPRTEKGNRYIFSLKDAFSKWIVTSEVVTQKYLTEGCLKLGTPRVVVTDNGTNFKSRTFTEALKLMGIEHQVTSPYHKNSNGQVERLHRILEECLSAYVNNTQSDWDNYLPFITFAINTLPNATMQTNPFETMFGREPRLPEDAQWNTPLPRFPNTEDYVTLLLLQLKETWKFVSDRLRTNNIKQKQKYDRTHRTAEREVGIGDDILIRRMPPKTKICPYLHGPFKVTKIDGANIEEIISHKDDKDFQKEAKRRYQSGTGKRTD
uniref:RNA-directed DNA polymerase n=1 Tax=Heterorhabditis bacteriophora TaxID=37862 RepID=A0A1I7W8B2_HETBA